MQARRSHLEAIAPVRNDRECVHSVCIACRRGDRRVENSQRRPRNGHPGGAVGYGPGDPMGWTGREGEVLSGGLAIDDRHTTGSAGVEPKGGDRHVIAAFRERSEMIRAIGVAGRYAGYLTYRLASSASNPGV